MKSHTKLVITISIILSSLLIGCASNKEIVLLSSEESAQVALHTDPAARNIITAIETNDYALFITDFDDKMREALTEKQFEAIVKMYGKNGKADSIMLLNVEDREQFFGANYGVTYPNATLKMLIVVSKSEPSLVSGLWFK